MECELVPITEAARRLGCGSTELMMRMRKCATTGMSFPLGFALPPSKDRGQWAYKIPRKRFETYMAGLDFTVPEGRLQALFDQQERGA